MKTVPLAEVGNFSDMLIKINERLEQLEKSVSDLKQYETDHNELHRVMAAATGKDTTAMQKLLAESIAVHKENTRLSVDEHSKQVAATLASNMQSMREMISAMATAIEQATGMPIEVHMPEPKERELLDYKLIRKGNLLDTIREVKQ